MATIAKELFGTKFMKTPKKVTLTTLLSNIDPSKSTVRVQPDQWRLRAMTDCYWTITSNPNNAHLLAPNSVFGILTWKSVPQKTPKQIEDVNSIHWSVLYSAENTQNLLNKFPGFTPRGTPKEEGAAEKESADEEKTETK